MRQCVDTMENWAILWSQHCSRRGLTVEQAEARMNEAWETCRMHGGNSGQFHFKCLSVQTVSHVPSVQRSFSLLSSSLISSNVGQFDICILSFKCRSV